MVVHECAWYYALAQETKKYVYKWRVHLQKTINVTLKKKRLFSTHSAIGTPNTFCQKSLYCLLSRHRKFTFYCRSWQAPLCLWTEADESILANQHAVFRSGDKANFTLGEEALRRMISLWQQSTARAIREQMDPYAFEPLTRYFDIIHWSFFRSNTPFEKTC